MIYGFGGRIDNDNNAVTMIDKENRTAETKGYINGEFVEFSSGGGGSSDFSTATVTIINGDDVNITGAFVGEDEYYQIEGELSLPYTSQPSGANTIVLYKGQALLHCDNNVASISGDIETASAQHGVYLVTGDCTITVS